MPCLTGDRTLRAFVLQTTLARHPEVPVSRRSLVVPVALLVTLAIACSGDKKSGSPTASCSVSAVAVAPGSATMAVGATSTFSATVSQTNCSNLVTAWSTGNPGVATVAQTGVVTGVAAGTTTITATAGGVAGNASITVTAPTCNVTAVAVTPTTLALAPADTTTLRASITGTNCGALTPTWSSSNSAVVTVNTAGLVTAVATGTATITATSNGVQGTSSVTVAVPPLGASWNVSQLRIAGPATAPVGFVNAAWGPSANDLFVASSGRLYRLNAGAWTRFSESGFGVDAMWGSSTTDVHGVGRRLLRYNGSSWTVLQSPTTQNMRSVWGSSANTVWAVGDAGAIIRFDGTSWTSASSPTTASIFGVSGSGPTFALAVTSTGQVLRWDGTAWTINASLGVALTSVWVGSATLAYATSSTGRVFRFDGTQWVEDGVARSASLRSVLGTSPTDVYIAGAGGFVAHYNGATWTTLPRRVNTNVLALAAGGSTVFAMGDNFLASLAPSGSTFLSYAPTLNAVHAVDDNTAFAVGDDGTIWRYNSGNWQLLNTGVMHQFSGVWAASATSVYAVGGTVQGQGVVMRFDGISWSEMSIPASGALTSIAGTSSNQLVAMSRFSPLLRFDGTSWSSTGLTPPDDATALSALGAGDYVIVGTGGIALRYTGGTLTPLPSEPGGATFVSVWGSSVSNILAGTNGSNMFRFNGTTWATTAAPSPGATYALWGTGPNSVYALTFNGEVMRFNGTTWTRLKAPEDALFFSGLHGTANRLFGVGASGAVMVTR